MAIVISGLGYPIEKKEEFVLEEVRKKYHITREDLLSSTVAKVSIDARKRQNIQLVYALEFQLAQEEQEDRLVAQHGNIKKKQTHEILVVQGTKKLEHPPVVVGFGPAGMFAALLLAQQGYAPLVLERGDSVDRRVDKVENFWKHGVLDVDTNVQFGEGGAGTFSDGKLTTRINDHFCYYVLKQLVDFGAPKEILVKSKPHIGTDKLRGVVKSIREEIIRLGGEVRFLSTVSDLEISQTQVKSVTVDGEKIPTSQVILAVGHSARDTFHMLLEKDLDILAKPFSVGVRIEHLQSTINEGLFGVHKNHPLLQKGEYQLAYRNQEKGRAAYTFCMCPGGLVVPSSSQEGTVVTNGMSEFARSEKNSNAGLVVSVGEKDFGLDPRKSLQFQLELEQLAFQRGGGNYQGPAQDVKSFLQEKSGYQVKHIVPSYALGVTPVDFHTIFPREITEMMKLGLASFGQKIRGFSAEDVMMTGVETRTSSPLRILREENLQAGKAKGLYPCGEGAGYAGGIVSAAVDGIHTAMALMQEYAPKQKG